MHLGAGLFAIVATALVVLSSSCVGDTPKSAAAGPNLAEAGAPDASATEPGVGPFVDSGAEAGPPCPEGSDPSSDASNCGTCGHACTGSFACTAGRCGNAVDEVAAALDFGCVLLHEGSVYCWGLSENGGLGVEPSAADDSCVDGANTYRCRVAPQKIPGLANITHIAAGFSHACAIDGNGALSCWGKNDASQLAQPTTVIHAATPITIAFPVAVSVVEVSIGQDTTCARTSTKDVYCWGANTQAQAGQPPSASPVPTPMLVGSGVFNHDISDVRVAADAGSGGHACAIREPGTVWCWGANANGEGGHVAAGTECGRFCNSTPVQAGTISGVTALSTGPGTTCALTSTVQCWGGNAYGELGELSTTLSVTPKAISGLPPSTIVGLVQGAWADFALASNGDVWAWGALGGGVLGDGATTGVACGALVCRANGAVEQVANLTNIAQVSFAYRTALARTRDGSVVAWGSNSYGNLGHLPNAPGAGDQTCDGSACQPVPVAVSLGAL